MAGDSSLLALRGATFGYGDVPAVRDVSLDVRQGEVVAVCGANGAGKTTLVRGICGRARMFRGEIRLHGEPASRRLSDLARRGLSLISDERALIRALSVDENLRLAGGDPQMALNLFPELGPLRRRRAGLLSGGEQQMLGIGAAMSRKPDLIVIDELSIGLAPIVTTRLLTALRAAADKGLAVLIVEQRIDLVAHVADRCVVLAAGAQVMTCTGAELELRFSELAQHYLGIKTSNDPAVYDQDSQA